MIIRTKMDYLKTSSVILDPIFVNINVILMSLGLKIVPLLPLLLVKYFDFYKVNYLKTIKILS